MALFIDTGTPFQRQRQQLYLELQPSTLPRHDELRLRDQKMLELLVVQLVQDPPLEKRKWPYLGGHYLVGSVLRSADELPKLRHLKIIGYRGRRYFDEDRRARYVSEPLLDGLVGRALATLELRRVDLELPNMVGFFRDCKLTTLALDRVHGDFDVKHLAWDRELSPTLTTINFDECDLNVVEFFTGAIRHDMKMHIGLGAGRDGVFPRDTWNVIAKSSSLLGIRTITFGKGTVFAKRDASIWTELLVEGEVLDVRLDDATFVWSAYEQFIRFVRKEKSPLRKLNVKYWNLVSECVFDELGLLLDAVQQGPMVWYSHTHISCRIGKAIAEKIHFMNLEVVHLEIVCKKGWRFPAEELVEAARTSGTLGVFADPERRCEAEKYNYPGLSAIGLRQYDFDIEKSMVSVDIFTEDQMDLLQQFARRNQREALRRDTAPLTPPRNIILQLERENKAAATTVPWSEEDDGTTESNDGGAKKRKHV